MGVAQAMEQYPEWPGISKIQFLRFVVFVKDHVRHDGRYAWYRCHQEVEQDEVVVAVMVVVVEQ